MTSTALIASNITSSSLQQHEFVGYGILIPCISIIGILFNVAILIIFNSKRNFPESTYVYLFDLALSDLLTLFFFATNCFGRAYFPDSYDWSVYEVYFYFPFGSMVSNASIFLTVTVTVERYIFIYHPLHSKHYCTPNIAGTVTKCIWIFSFLFNIPRFFVMLPEQEGQLAFTTFGTSLSYKVIVWVYFIVNSATPSLVLIVFNILLILAIQRRRTQLNALKGTQNMSLKGTQEIVISGTQQSSLKNTQQVTTLDTTQKNVPQSMVSVDKKSEGSMHEKESSRPDNEISIETGANDIDHSIATNPSKSAVEKLEYNPKKQNNSKCFEIIEKDNHVSSFQASDQIKADENKSKPHQSNFTARSGQQSSLKQHQQQRDDFRLTLTLIGVVLVFLLGEVPSALLSRNTVVPFKGEEVLEKNWYRKALLVCTLLVVNQHSTNFIVYCLFNKKFCSFVKKRLITIKSSLSRK